MKNLQSNSYTCSGNNGWSIERQVRLISGLLVLIGIGLSVIINPVWLLMSFVVALGMVVSSVMGTCALGYLVEKLPWNWQKESDELDTVS